MRLCRKGGGESSGDFEAYESSRILWQELEGAKTCGEVRRILGGKMADKPI